MGQDTKFTVPFFFCMYGYGFLSPGFTDQREILHSGSATSQTGLLLFWGIVPGMAEFLASTGWQDMLLADALILHLIYSVVFNVVFIVLIQLLLLHEVNHY